MIRSYLLPVVTWREMGKQSARNAKSPSKKVSFSSIISLTGFSLFFKMVHYCCSQSCTNNSTDTSLSFHKFPDDPKLRKVSINIFFYFLSPCFHWCSWKPILKTIFNLTRFYILPFRFGPQESKGTWRTSLSTIIQKFVSAHLLKVTL